KNDFPVILAVPDFTILVSSKYNIISLMLYLEDTRMVKSGTAKITGKSFFGNILQAVGAGVVIALIPNALLGELLKFFKEGNQLLETVYQLVVLIQSFMAFIIGVLAAHQFKFNGAGVTMIGVSAMIGSGAVK